MSSSEKTVQTEPSEGSEKTREHAKSREQTERQVSQWEEVHSSIRFFAQ